jgi:hypothetical protein
MNEIDKTNQCFYGAKQHLCHREWSWIVLKLLLN